MNVTSKERSLRRRLLFNAMPESASEAVVKLCIQILDNEYGDNPEIKYSQLIKRLSDAVQGNMNFGPVLGRIMIAKGKPLEEIGPDPGGVRTRNDISELNAGEVVFNTMLTTITEQVRNRGRQKEINFRRELLSRCFESPITNEFKHALEEWSFDPEASPIRGTPAEFQLVINACYVWMCVDMGPTEADRILNYVVSNAQRLPQSFEFSPKTLL